MTTATEERTEVMGRLRVPHAATHPDLGTTSGTNVGSNGAQSATIHKASPQLPAHGAICGSLGIQSRSTVGVLTCDNIKFSTIHSSYYYYYNIQLSASSKEARLSGPRNRNGINS